MNKIIIVLLAVLAIGYAQDAGIQTESSIREQIHACLNDKSTAVKCVADVLGPRLASAKDKLEVFLKSASQKARDFLEAKGQQIKEIIENRETYFEKAQEKAIELKEKAAEKAHELKEKASELKEKAKAWFNENFGSDKRKKRQTESEAPVDPEVEAALEAAVEAAAEAAVEAAVEPAVEPEVETPTEPEVDIPDVDIPDVDIPDVDIPDVEVPDVEIPDIDVPEPEVPEPAVTIPEPEVPKPDIGSGPIPPTQAATASLRERIQQCLKDKSTAVKCVATALGTSLAAAKVKVEAVLKTASQKVKDFFKAKGRKIKEIIENRETYLQKLKEKATGIKDKVSSKAHQLKEKAKNWFDEHFGSDDRKKRNVMSANEKEVRLAQRIKFCMEKNGETDSENCMTKILGDKIDEYDTIHIQAIINYEAVLQELKEYFKAKEAGKTLHEFLADQKAKRAHN